MAMLLGAISPKSRIVKASPVAESITLSSSEIPRRCAYWRASIVLRDVAAMLTTLFPIRMVLSSLSLFSMSLIKVFRFFFLDLEISIRSISLRETNALSVPEKKADKKISSTRVIIPIINATFNL
jgi:hypothetical protein